VSRRFYLFLQLVRRDLAIRYAGSFGGIGWALLGPLLQCGIYTLVFSVIVRIPPPPGFAGHYAEFLLAGLLPWLGFQDALGRSASAITDHGQLVKKLSFPVETLVFSALAAALLLQAVALVVFAAVSVAAGTGTIRLLPLVAGFLLEFLVLLGPAFAFSAVTVLFRDFSQILGPLLSILFYLTPIIYPENLVPDTLAFGLSLNPLRDVAGLFRAGLLGMEAPPAARVAGWAAVSAVLAFGGAVFFGRSRKTFPDVL
jgi:ABC-type polysaccharide/polyol phosphate export permease